MSNDEVRIDELDAAHVPALVRFFEGLPPGDLTFIREDVSADAVRNWVEERGRRWVAMDTADDTVIGFVAVLPLNGWSDHVGELRLIVHPEHRRTGLGRALARHALTRSLDAGLRKIVVELVADQEYTIAMFNDLGFTGEALLRDHIRDRDGNLRDLIMLAHLSGDAWPAADTVGIAHELGV